jgi:hypothetical protein
LDQAITLSVLVDNIVSAQCGVAQQNSLQAPQPAKNAREKMRGNQVAPQELFFFPQENKKEQRRYPALSACLLD